MSEAAVAMPVPEWPARLRDLMAASFNLAELEALCFDLGLDYEELAEGGKGRKILSLIRLVAEAGRLVALIDLCRALRPHLDLSELRAAAEQDPALFQVPAEALGQSYVLSGDFRGAVINIQSTLVGAAEVRDIEDQPPEPGEPPYKGLQYFDESDADHFFGRELLTAQVVARLRQARFLAVIGASGSGKSSLVRAGVIPALRRGLRLADDSLPPPGSGRWAIHLITPSAHPLYALAATLARQSESVTAVSTLQAELAAGPQTLALAGRQLLARQERPHLLLVIDQFEEIFTLCRQPEERLAFIDNLVAAVAAGESGGAAPVTILISLRADFYAHCAQHDALRQLVSQHQEYIGAMSRGELFRAILQPAALGEWRLQQGLVDLMLRDVGEEPGALPLLSHALLETWLRRRGRTMTLSGYKESGGVRGAIAQTAETVFQQRLLPEQRPIARMIFVRLTELGESGAGDRDTPDTRRRAAFSEMITRATDPEMLNAVLGILTEARLVTTGKALPEGTQVVEVAHEALIREWPTLRHWIDEDRDNLVRQRQLTADVNDWLKLERDAGALYRGARLEQMLAWVDQFPEPLSLEEQAFLQASQAVTAEERARQQRLQRSQRLQRVLAGVTALLIVALIGILASARANSSRQAAVTATICVPQVMAGDFNVAVAEFAVLDAGGRLAGDNSAGRQLAARVQNNLLAAFDGAGNVQVWADGDALRQAACVMIGRVGDDLAGVEAPAAAAARLNADLLVYGVARPADDRGELQVKFYLAPQLGHDFTNIIGVYAFERVVPIFDLAQPGREVEATLGPQAQALAYVARGFTWELQGQSARALADFEQAAALVPDADFVHVFAGQAYLFLAQADAAGAAGYEAAAAAAFARAPDNARGQIGLAGVHFVRAQRQLNAMLDEAAGVQETVLAAVEAEALAGLALFRQVADAGNQMEIYGAPVDQIGRLGEAITYRLLGETAYYQGDPEAAGAYIEQALVALAAAGPSLEGFDDHRLRAQFYQAAGSVYEWQAFLRAEAGDTSGSEAARQEAQVYYGRCRQEGERFPFDTYLLREIVAKLCGGET